MTILIGFKEQDTVTITADIKSTHFNKSNDNQGTFDTVNKVFPIGENMIIGIAGLNELGLGIKTMLHSVFKLPNNLSVEESIIHVEKTCVYAHSMFKEVHPERDAPLLLVVAGLDRKINKSYLYLLSSKNQFEPNEMGEKNLTIQGTSRENVEKFLFQQPHNIKSNDELIKTFSAAIRSTDDELVSKDSYSITLFYNEQRGFSGDIWSIDAEGNMKYLDLEGNEIIK
ncbi:hypothetical protein [Peribacillus frigoritolerans]